MNNPSEVLPHEVLDSAAQYYEYVSSVNPILAPVPAVAFSSILHKEGGTRIIPFDLSNRINCSSLSTTPNVSASYIKVCPGETIETMIAASAQMFYVIRGKGKTYFEEEVLEWSEGDLFVLPAATKSVRHAAVDDVALYAVNDSPLLEYLGAKPSLQRFPPTVYPHARLKHELQLVDEEPGAQSRNRDAIILGNKYVEQIKSATHTLWSAFVQVHPGGIQRPHKHNSVAVDIVVTAGPNCYTLIGSAIDDKGDIINPQRIDWESGAAFVTPPGLWHGHYNEGNQTSIVMAVQEAGFYEHMRTLNIQFADPD